MKKFQWHTVFSKYSFILLIFLCNKIYAQTGEDSLTPTVVKLDSVIVGESQSISPPEDEKITITEEKKTYFLQQPEALDSNSVTLQKVRPLYIDSLKKLDAFWYADSAFYENGKPIKTTETGGGKEKGKQQYDTQPKEKTERDTSTSRSLPAWLDTFIWVLLAAIFVGLLTWYLMSSNILVFGKRKRKIESDAGDMEEMPEDIFSIPYEREIQKATANKNFRLATRLLFLQMLRQMADRNVIQYKQERTNFDYLSQLYKTNYYEGFMKLARNYEYAWYGKFEVSEDAFATIKKDAEQLQSKFY